MIKVMKSVFVSMLLTAGVSAVVITPDNPPIQLMGEIVSEGSGSDTMPPFHIYFAGTRVETDRNGLYRLSIDDHDKALLDDLSLMICKRFSPELEQGNTVAGMKVKKLGKCIWYKLDREWDARAKRYYWLITQQSIGEQDIIPDKCLIISLSSQYVDRVENVEFSPSGIVSLPRIVLKTEEDQLRRSSTKSLIEGIESRAFCDRQHVQQTTVNGVEIALPMS